MPAITVRPFFTQLNFYLWPHYAHRAHCQGIKGGSSPEEYPRSKDEQRPPGGS